MKTYQFKIQIQGIQKPPVWRRVIVPSNITFDTFHQIIQAAFGWNNYHLYQFSEFGWGSEKIYEIPDIEDDYEVEKTENSYLIKISEVFKKPKQTFTYIYDFGDNWKHDIILEEILDEKIMRSMCVDGKGTCPPEDSGGIPGYQNLIDILNDPKRPEYKDMINWLGIPKNTQWDVNAFDKNIANERCSQIAITI